MVSLLISPKPFVLALFVPSIPDIPLLVHLSVVTIHLGCLGFIGEMGYPQKTNAVTQNNSGEEGEAAAIIADVGSHWMKQRKYYCRKSAEPYNLGKFQPWRLGRNSEWVRSNFIFESLLTSPNQTWIPGSNGDLQ